MGASFGRVDVGGRRGRGKKEQGAEEGIPGGCGWAWRIVRVVAGVGVCTACDAHGGDGSTAPVGKKKGRRALRRSCRRQRADTRAGGGSAQRTRLYHWGDRMMGEAPRRLRPPPPNASAPTLPETCQHLGPAPPPPRRAGRPSTWPLGRGGQARAPTLGREKEASGRRGSNVHRMGGRGAQSARQRGCHPPAQEGSTGTGGRARTPPTPRAHPLSWDTSAGCSRGTGARASAEGAWVGSGGGVGRGAGGGAASRTVVVVVVVVGWPRQRVQLAARRAGCDPPRRGRVGGVGGGCCLAPT